MELALETYTPSEAEEITKVAQTTVRNWRRAGHLTRHEGKARYNIADLLNLAAMQALVSRGVTPGAAKGFSSGIAEAAFQNMIYSNKAFSIRANEAANTKSAAAPADGMNRLTAALSEGFDPKMIAALQAQETLMGWAKKQFGLSGKTQPIWFIIWANGEMQFYYDEDISEETFFGNSFYADDHLQGPVTLFSLGAIAQMIVDRLPRPPLKLVGEA